MNNIKKGYLISLLLFSSFQTIYGQKTFHDSITVQIDDKMVLNMTVFDFKVFRESVTKDLKSLRSILKDKSGITKDESYSIIYVPDNMLTIKQNGAGERIIWGNGKQIRYQFNNQCNIQSDIYSLQVQFNELEMLLSDNLIRKLNEVIDTTITIRGRFTATYNYSFQGDNLVHNKQLDKINGQMDVLSLKGGIGVNLIKSQPVIDLSAEIGFIFSKNGIWKNQYYLSYNQLSHFEDNSKINANNFINIGYRHNLSNTFGKPNWLGIELGYLAIRQGDLFEKNTFKFGVNWEIGKYMSVSPQLYFSRSFGYPAVRIGFGF